MTSTFDLEVLLHRALEAFVDELLRAADGERGADEVAAGLGAGGVEEVVGLHDLRRRTRAPARRRG